MNKICIAVFLDAFLLFLFQFPHQNIPPAPDRAIKGLMTEPTAVSTEDNTIGKPAVSTADNIPPVWFGLAFLRIRLPYCDTATNDLKSRVEFAGGT